LYSFDSETASWQIKHIGLALIDTKIQIVPLFIKKSARITWLKLCTRRRHSDGRWT